MSHRPREPSSEPSSEPSMQEHRHQTLERHHRRALRWGLTASVLLHALLFLTFDDRPLPLSPFAAAGERSGDAVAALGGGLQAVELMAPPEPAVTPPEPDPTPTPDAVEVEPPEASMEDVGLPTIALADALRLPGPVGVVELPGVAAGTGQGDGGTELEGRFRVVPPRPRGMILPPGDRPDGVRGREVEVWVFVSAAGRVVADSTRLNPPTGDRRFDRRLREHAAGWRFDAARLDGRAVAEWFRYTIIM